MDNESGLQGIAIALCRVEGSMNVGAACRAMKSMGIARLILADCPAYDEVEVRTHALLAFDVYETAERYATLREALSGFGLAAGFTRRVGQRRKENMTVEAFAATLAERVGAATALVFGNERDGLSDAELALCDEAVGIASSSLFPSLNLSHAVQIACWELRKSLRHASSAEGRMPAIRASTERAALEIADALQAAGFYKIAGRPEAETFLRSIAARAALSEAELERFSSLFIKLGALSASRA
ncbi:MAG: hypothetical protein A2Y38_19740 [Spirochaetes bacterium GWB1_59_5]|nr:MAG: hypothetical protein A2Y38_19740 [Spirochaetes bacterium GWB1_59_5]